MSYCTTSKHCLIFKKTLGLCMPFRVGMTLSKTRNVHKWIRKKCQHFFQNLEFRIWNFLDRLHMNSGFLDIFSVWHIWIDPSQIVFGIYMNVSKFEGFTPQCVLKLTDHMFLRFKISHYNCNYIRNKVGLVGSSDNLKFHEGNFITKIITLIPKSVALYYFVS